jgi:hypothetical protein
MVSLFPLIFSRLFFIENSATRLTSTCWARPSGTCMVSKWLICIWCSCLWSFLPGVFSQFGLIVLLPPLLYLYICKISNLLCYTNWKSYFLEFEYGLQYACIIREWLANADIVLQYRWKNVNLSICDRSNPQGSVADTHFFLIPDPDPGLFCEFNSSLCRELFKLFFSSYLFYSWGPLS